MALHLPNNMQNPDYTFYVDTPRIDNGCEVTLPSPETTTYRLSDWTDRGLSGLAEEHGLSGAGDLGRELLVERLSKLTMDDTMTNYKFKLIESLLSSNRSKHKQALGTNDPQQRESSLSGEANTPEAVDEIDLPSTYAGPTSSRAEASSLTASPTPRYSATPPAAGSSAPQHQSTSTTTQEPQTGQCLPVGPHRLPSHDPTLIADVLERTFGKPAQPLSSDKLEASTTQSKAGSSDNNDVDQYSGPSRSLFLEIIDDQLLDLRARITEVQELVKDFARTGA